MTSTSRSPGEIRATTPGSGSTASRPLPRHDVTNVNGIKVTSIARTICDLAATESPRATEQAFQEALYREIVTDKALKAVLAREPAAEARP